MRERRTVIEVVATAALEVDVPVDYGDELGAGVATVLAEIGGIRHAAIEEFGNVTSLDDHLRVEVYTWLTFHFDPSTVEDAERAARELLAVSDAVASVTAFAVESGPYRIESW